MDDLQHVPQEIETLSLEQQAEALVQAAELRVNVLNRVAHIALKRTLQQDWVNMGGKPYLTAAGAERIRPMFRIEIVNVDSKRYEERDDRGLYYYFVVTCTARTTYKMGGQTFEDQMSVMGTCSARDPFFSTRYEGDGAERHQVYLPASEVDPTNIVKSAYSNMLVNAVTRILGMRNLTWEQLESLGFDRTKAATVVFGARKGEKPQERPSGRREGPQEPGAEKKSSLDRLRDLLATVSTDPATTVQYLKTLTRFQGRDGKWFKGFDSFEGIGRSKNAEKIAQIAFDKLEKQIKDGAVEQTSLLGKEGGDGDQQP